MSGHSKWATIKRAKGVADAKRSQTFTKLAKAVTVAARNGADPSMNFKLRLAIDRARQANMPKDNIERAVKRGAGAEGGAQLTEIRYEGYGPGGVAFLIDALTDNRNRTSGNVRHLLEQHGGRLAEAGSVAWQFQNQGVVQITAPANHDELDLALIEAGATDIQTHEDILVIACEPHSLESIKSVLAAQNLTPTYANVEPVANTKVEVTDAAVQKKLNDLREALDNDEDVNDFYDNEA